MDGSSGAIEGNNDDGSGRRWKELYDTHNLKTTEGLYYVSIKMTKTLSTNPQAIGINSLFIISSDDWDKGYRYLGRFNYENPQSHGIVIENKNTINEVYW